MSEVELHTYIDEITGMIEGSSYDIAIAHCKHILGRYPKYIEAYRMIGKAALEKEDDGMALDIFQRVLAADPEDFVARVGMSIIYDRQGDMDKAIWHMERAYDLMPSNGVIQGELKRLYAHRDGIEPTRISLTRGALARMYTQGDLYPEAIADINQMLQEQPDRLDLQVLLVQALWRNEQRIEAAEWAQKILRQLPYCLTSNLILGEVWHSDAQNVESEVPLRRAQQIDPENSFAAKFFGAASPLPAQTVMIERYEEPYSSMSGGAAMSTPPIDEVPDWLRGLTDVTATPQLTGREASPQLPTGLHMPDTGPLQTEAPDWLQGLVSATDQVAEPPAQPTPAAAAEAEPDWLTQMRSMADQPEAEAPQVDESADVPNWLNNLNAAQPAVEEEMPPAAPSAEAETPDWLSNLGGTEASVPPAQPSSEADMPDWLSNLAGAGSAVPPAQPSSEADMPDWLSNLAGAGSTVPAAQPSGESEMPDWLSNLGGAESAHVPPAEPSSESETPDWLSNLGGAEANVPPAQPSSEAEVPDWLRQLGTGSLDIESTEAPAEPAGEMPDWLANLKPSVGETKSAVADPDWLSSIKQADNVPPLEPAPLEVPEEMSSPDDALAFLARLSAGKEDQLRAQAQQEADVRMNEIMGRKTPVQPEKPVVAAKPTPPPEPAPLEMPEEMSSPDDALAFLARLSAGKEDQLRAQAEQEAAVRMNEIMGRKTPAQPEKPVIPQPPAAVKPTPPPEPAPLEVPEEMSSPDDALAFLARLSAGKEDQLRAQAEQEADVRMNEIMGRKAAPPVKKPVAQPEPVQPPAKPPITLSESVKAPAAKLAAHFERPALPLKPVEPSVTAQPAMSQEEALAFVQNIASDKESKMTHLRPSQPAEPVQSKTKPEPEPIAPVSFAAPVTPPEPPAPAEPVAAVQPLMSTGQPSTSVLLPVWWWTQVADDEGEEPIVELPEPYHSPRSMVATQSGAPSAPVKRASGMLTPARETAAPKLGTAPLAAPTPAKPTVNVEPLLARLQADANDRDARLELARAWWSSGNRDQALEHYSTLVAAGAHSDETLNDLERIVEIDDRADWHRLLGDVCMKSGKLTRALEAYHHALEKL
jgi:tetratricopeptide (TPR) repeat protein